MKKTHVMYLCMLLLGLGLAGCESSEGLPDLVVDEITCEEGNLHLTVTNQGKGGLPDTWTALASVYVNSVTQEDVILNEPTSTEEGGIQEPGGTSHYLTSIEINNVSYVDVALDYTYEINEVSEENNIRKTVYVAPCNLPDLVVSDLTLDEDCYVIVTLKNIGTGMVPEEAWNQIFEENCALNIYKDGAPFSSKCLFQIDTTHDLQPVEGSAAFKTDLRLSGTSVVTAVVDATGNILEMDERNNTRGKELACEK